MNLLRGETVATTEIQIREDVGTVKEIVEHVARNRDTLPHPKYLSILTEAMGTQQPVASHRHVHDKHLATVLVETDHGESDEAGDPGTEYMVSIYAGSKSGHGLVLSTVEVEFREIPHDVFTNSEWINFETGEARLQ